MAEIEMPEGRYFSLSGMIRPGTGGQTRALLMRNRILTQKAGVEPTLVTFDSPPIYPEVRAALEKQGQLVPGMRLLNIFEWCRNHGGFDGEPIADSLPKLDGFITEDELHPDGTVYLTKYHNERAGALHEAVRDYRRPDGSVYLRAPAGAAADSTPATPYIVTNGQGAPTHSWPRKGGWHRLWLRTLAGDAERVFVISDSRFALAHVAPMRDQRFHLLHLMHNTHTVGERRWDSTLSPDYGPLLNGIDKIDGLVTLTKRQREDVMERYGATNNLFVVPNPVDLPELPEDPPPRERARFAVVSRLERQKRLDDAVRAFALVLEQEPEARLDIYGDGILRVPLQTLIDELGIGHAVTLCGHSPHARDNLLTATAFLMTSRSEGYPLASLESMSRGCPVVSYDIKYGPREQIADGVDGFLTAAGDLQTFADRVVTMIRDPGLVEKMSAAAIEKAQLHDYRAFLRDWRSALETAAANKVNRVRLDGVDLHVARLGRVRAGRLPRRLVRPRAAPGAFRRPPEVELDAAVHLHGKGRPETLDMVAITLDAVCDATGGVTNIPVIVHRDRRRFAIRARFDVEQVFAELGPADRDVRLRLRVVWNNASWETTLARPSEQRAPIELNYTADDSLLISRGAGQDVP
jgi:poly(glycerol-phosphate) alpha-glucosyltransferase